MQVLYNLLNKILNIIPDAAFASGNKNNRVSSILKLVMLSPH